MGNSSIRRTKSERLWAAEWFYVNEEYYGYNIP